MMCKERGYSGLFILFIPLNTSKLSAINLGVNIYMGLFFSLYLELNPMYQYMYIHPFDKASNYNTYHV